MLLNNLYQQLIHTLNLKIILLFFILKKYIKILIKLN